MFPYRTGSARGKITPPAGVPLGGNARSDNYAIHVVHDLYVRALYVRSAESAVCILSLDLLGLFEQDARRLREHLAAATGLLPENVMMACTHTHSAPDTLRLFCSTDEKTRMDREVLAPWMEILFTKATDVVQRAMAGAVPSRLQLMVGENRELVHNRRLRLRSGQTVMNWTLPGADSVAEVLGPVDPQVTVAAFYNVENSLSGALVHYTLHPAILAGRNLGISGDYCGLAMELLEQQCHCADSTAIVFLNGALGNINHIDYRKPDRNRDVEEVERCATSLVSSVMELLGETATAALSPAEDNIVVSAAYEEMLFPIREIPEGQLEEASSILERSRNFTMAEADGVPPEMEAQRTLRLNEIKSTGRSSGEFTTLQDGKVLLPLQVIRIGALSLSAVPAEMFVEHGLQLKQQSGNQFALMVCPANGYLGYIPTKDAFPQGGYETGLGPGYLPADAGDKILKKLKRMQSSNERTLNEIATRH